LDSASTAERHDIAGEERRHTDASLRRVAVLGNHLPRHCGIATFTTHLAAAVTDAAPLVDCLVVAVNDPGMEHAYPACVRFEIAEADATSYQRAADYLNVNDVDLVSVQHEFGIFGGKAGSHLLLLLSALRMPIVTTLHTILQEPNPAQRFVMQELVRLSQRLIVMSTHSAQVLASVYGVPPDTIDVIPHGIPHVPATQASKHRLGVGGHSVMLTFGLLSPDKGIEYVIEALPAIIAAAPEVIYIVLGATHPHVKAEHGEAYRVMLEARARQLGVDQHVIFHDRFVSQDELTEFLGATDIYVTPYLNPEQSTSGTLAYALGSGRAVISTPYVYARELLANDRGVLVPWRDPAAIATAVTSLLTDDQRRSTLRQKAAIHGRAMLWPAVADQYLASFTSATREHAAHARAARQTQTLATRLRGLPEISLRHLRALTDDTGLLQHANFCIPRYSEGYCLDDNARALLLMARLEEAGTEDHDQVRLLAARYLAFVHAAFNQPRGRFRNFLTYARTWVEEIGSEDCHGRGLHALGTVIGRSNHPGRTSLASELFHAALPSVRAFTSPRAWATALLGIEEYLRAFEGDRRVQELRALLADRLRDLYTRAAVTEWPWFEDRLTYANAQLPHALIISGARMGREDLLTLGLNTLTWLTSMQCSPEGHFAPIGSNGFSVKGSQPATFDQQPIEAATMIAACIDAERITGAPQWNQHARHAFDWFLGQNHLRQWLYDPSTGGCRDGLHAERVNENQGAESTLAFLLALVDMRALDRPEIPALLTTHD
jgi:glycosyltransferase involved in cell wall biosynthesis